MPEHDQRIAALRATAHPVRLRMLSLLTGSAMSAAEVARELGLTHANASYHLRVLHDVGEIVEAGEERIRGGTAKRYRYPYERALAEPPDPARPRATPEERVVYVRAVAGELERRIREQSGRARHSDLEGWVAPEVWTEACRLLEEASRLLHEANRAPRTPGTIHVNATTWAFEMTSDPAEKKAP